MKKTLPRISVVMSNYNGITLKLLLESVNAILNNDYPNLEVIVVDNASTDKSVAILKKQFSSNKSFKIIENSINMYSQGLNLGIKKATGEYIAFFNNDAIVENGYFQKFISYLEDKPKVALAQGMLLSYYNHNIIDSAGETMDFYGNPITIGAGQSATIKKFNDIYEVLSVSGSCSIMRASIVKEIGYFDDDYGIGYEDLDLALRAWMRGYKVIYYPYVRAFHKRGATDLDSSIRIQARSHFNKNRIATLVKNFPLYFLLKNLPITVGIYICAGLWEIIIKKDKKLGMTRFTALVWVMQNIHTIFLKRVAINKKNYRKIQSLLDTNSLMQTIRSFMKIT